MNKQLGIGVLIGIVVIYLVAMVIPSTYARDNPLIIQSGSGGGGETTQCINMATQYQIIVNSTGGNCFVRSLANGTGITLATNTTHVIINSTSSGEVNTASCVGSVSPFSECIFFDKNGQDLRFKRLLEGASINLATNGTHILITNTAPDNTTCANVGTGVDIYKDGECNFRTLISDNPAITLTQNTNDITITPKWELLCSTTLVSSNSTVDCNDFTPRKTLFFTAELIHSGALTNIIVDVNGDSGNNYAWRRSINGGADTTTLSTNGCLLQSPSSGFSQLVGYVYNIDPTARKTFILHYTISADNNASVVGARIEETCKWANNTDAIDSIRINNGGSGSYSADTVLTVWGYD